MSWEHLTGVRDDWTAEERSVCVADTWQRARNTISPRHNNVFVRTDKPRLMTKGGLHIPLSETDFLAHVPKGKLAWATVVAASDEVDVRPGDRVLFPRYNFAWVERFNDDTYLGWVPDQHLLMVDTLTGDEDGDGLHGHP